MVLLRQISNLFKQLKAVAGVVTSVAVIAGATLWITSTSNNNQSAQDDNFNRMFDSIAEVRKLAEYNNIEIGFHGEMLHNINDSLDKINEDNEKQGEDIESVAWAISNINNFTAEQLQNILQRELKKNNGRIVSAPTLYADTSITWSMR